MREDDEAKCVAIFLASRVLMVLIGAGLLFVVLRILPALGLM